MQVLELCWCEIVTFASACARYAMQTWARRGFYRQFNTLPLPAAPPRAEEFRGSRLISTWSSALSNSEKGELCIHCQ